MFIIVCRDIALCVFYGIISVTSSYLHVLF